VLLGPQRAAHVAVPSGLDGRRRDVTAGWQEREPDDAELDALLDGRSVNLALLRPLAGRAGARPGVRRRRARAPGRARRAQRAAPRAARRGAGALREVARRGGGGPRCARGRAPTPRPSVRLVDDGTSPGCRRRTPRSRRWRPAERDAVARHRAAVPSGCAARPALVVAGGHVGVLVHVLRLFASAGPAVVSPGRPGRWR
jgi:hypothetical protein